MRSLCCFGSSVRCHSTRISGEALAAVDLAAGLGQWFFLGVERGGPVRYSGVQVVNVDDEVGEAAAVGDGTASWASWSMWSCTTWAASSWVRAITPHPLTTRPSWLIPIHRPQA
jgi:hypothetical protein